MPHFFKNTTPFKVPSSVPTLSTPSNNPGPGLTPPSIDSAPGSANGLTSPLSSKKKKKKKRRHSETETPTIQIPIQTKQDLLPPELRAEHKKLKKSKKRKLEGKQNGAEAHRDEGQEDDWCLGETWRIKTGDEAPAGGSEKKPRSIKESEMFQNSSITQSPSLQGSTEKEKKKKKKKKSKESKPDAVERFAGFL